MYIECHGEGSYPKDHIFLFLIFLPFPRGFIYGSTYNKIET